MEEQRLIGAWLAPFHHLCRFAIHSPRQAAKVSSEPRVQYRVEGTPCFASNGRDKDSNEGGKGHRLRQSIWGKEGLPRAEVSNCNSLTQLVALAKTAPSVLA